MYNNTIMHNFFHTLFITLPLHFFVFQVQPNIHFVTIMKRLIIAFTIILSSLTIAQTPNDLYILNKKIIPKIQTLTLEESQHIYDRLINYQTKTKTARQRFFP